jgi:hypothetical protein
MMVDNTFDAMFSGVIGQEYQMLKLQHSNNTQHSGSHGRTHNNRLRASIQAGRRTNHNQYFVA